MTTSPREVILKIFLKSRKFQPLYSCKIQSYKKECIIGKILARYLEAVIGLIEKAAPPLTSAVLLSGFEQGVKTATRIYLAASD